MGYFTPSTVPGCRAPHFWLPDGRSLYDAFGQGYTLLRFDPAIDVSRLQVGAKSRRMPLTLLDLDHAGAPPEYRHKLLLVRDDQHVAWRADATPADVEGLVGTLCGERLETLRLAA